MNIIKRSRVALCRRPQFLPFGLFSGTVQKNSGRSIKLTQFCLWIVVTVCARVYKPFSTSTVRGDMETLFANCYKYNMPGCPGTFVEIVFISPPCVRACACSHTSVWIACRKRKSLQPISHSQLGFSTCGVRSCHYLVCIWVLLLPVYNYGKQLQQAFDKCMVDVGLEGKKRNKKPSVGGFGTTLNFTLVDSKNETRSLGAGKRKVVHQQIEKGKQAFAPKVLITADDRCAREETDRERDVEVLAGGSSKRRAVAPGFSNS